MRSSQDCLRSAEKYLGARIANAREEALLLLSGVLGVPRDRLLLESLPLDGPLLARFNRWVARRGERREPLGYITGTAAFCELDLEVTPSVLIPRSSTESVAERACRARASVAADIGTGSGAIAVLLARRRPELRLIATDISASALEVARRNAGRLGVSQRIDFRLGDLLAPLRDPVDLIVANPPYVPSGVLPTLEPEVRHEPRIALDGGPDGTGLLGPLIRAAPGHLGARGTLLVEFGSGQAEVARAFAEEAGLREIRIHSDVDGLERFLEARRVG